MPRTPRRKDVQPVATALVASATRYPGKAARIYAPRQDWQTEAYRHYAICGEARFAAKFFGHAVSRAVLSIGDLVDGAMVEQKTGPAAVELDALFAGKDGQRQMLEAIGIHLTVGGECYLVGRTIEGVDVWEIVSCLEMKVAGDTWQIEYGRGVPVVTLTEEDVVIRIWLPSPGNRMEADSPFKSLLPILSEIEWLTRHVFAQIQSRLAGAGILFLPQGMSFPPPPAIDGNEQQTANDAEAFMVSLAEAMLKPIEDPSSPAAVTPIVVTAPDELVDKAKLLTFWSELDAQSLALRNEAIRRFALGMDVPPEQILGMGSNPGTGGGTSNGVSHWGAWQIEEATIKLHIEPMLDVVCNALTTGFLRPLLPDGSTIVVIYSTAALRLRPDRSKEAFQLWDRGLITDEALRRENGFGEQDAPDEGQFQRWLLTKVASGSATAEQVQAALSVLGVVLPVVAPAESPATREAQPAPSLEEHPNRDMPEESALIRACDALVYRALERAGNRLRQAGGKPPGVPSYETHVHVSAVGVHNVLDDAWSCAPQILEGLGDHERIVPVLDSYCKALLMEQSPHKRERLTNWLRLREEVPA